MYKYLLLSILVFFGLIFSAHSQTVFKFKLPYSCQSSAGVYLSDGTLVRTLWRHQHYEAGAFLRIWDNRDDQGQLVTGQKFLIKVLYHNVNYHWDGPIGNTSAAQSGKHVFQGFYPLMSMAATDTANFYVSGYSENTYNLHWFNRGNCHFETSFGRADTYTALGLICTDGERLYIADNEGGYHEGGSISFVYAINLSNKTDFHFSENHPFSINYRERLYESVIDFDNTSIPTKSFPPAHTFIQHGASGMAVQKQGLLLAIAHFNKDSILIYNKISGHLEREISARNVTSLAMSANNDLWAVANGKVICYTHLSTRPVIKTQITGFSNPLAIATDPMDDNLVIVADGGDSQQIKAFTKSGLLLFTLGTKGGYDHHGVNIENNKFWFRQIHMGDFTYVTILNDHTFWFGDTGNNRSLHFNFKQKLLEQIAYQPTNYSCSVDVNNASRVFSEYLEFKVDYSKPTSQSWQLKKNWLSGLDPNYFGEFNGIKQVVTMKNKRTYALLNNQKSNLKEIVELAADSIRLTHICPVSTKSNKISFQPDGSLIITPLKPDLDSNLIWYRQNLLGFTTIGDPLYGKGIEIARVHARATDPISRSSGFGDVKTPITSTHILISFDQSKNKGFHLGAIRLGGAKWLWKASPTGELDGTGNYDIGNGVQYAGNTVMASGRNIVYGYHGEFWKQSQAGQFMHFYDDGLFVGEFGQSSHGHSLTEGAISGFAGNGFSPSLVKNNGYLYLWVNDESSNGPQRWEIRGLESIHEIMGAGQLNSTIILGL